MTPRGLADQRAPDISNTPPPANSKASQSRIDLLPHAATTIGPINSIATAVPNRSSAMASQKTMFIPMVTQPNTPATSPTRLVNSQRAGRTTTRSTTPAAATRNHATIVGGKRSNSPTARAAPAYSDSPADHSSQKPAEGALNEDFQDKFCDFAPQSSKFQGWPHSLL